MVTTWTNTKTREWQQLEVEIASFQERRRQKSMLCLFLWKGLSTTDSWEEEDRGGEWQSRDRQRDTDRQRQMEAEKKRNGMHERNVLKGFSSRTTRDCWFKLRFKQLQQWIKYLSRLLLSIISLFSQFIYTRSSFIPCEHVFVVHVPVR